MTLLRKTAPLPSHHPLYHLPASYYEAFPTVNASYNYFSLALTLARALLFVLFSVLKRRQNNLGPRTFRSTLLFRYFQISLIKRRERLIRVQPLLLLLLFLSTIKRDTVLLLQKIKK